MSEREVQGFGVGILAGVFTFILVWEAIGKNALIVEIGRQIRIVLHDNPPPTISPILIEAANYAGVTDAVVLAVTQALTEKLP